MQDAGYGVLEVRPQHGPGRPPSKVFKLTAEFIDNIDFDKTLSGDAAAGVLSESILSKDHGVGSDAKVNGLSAAPACVDPLDKTLVLNERRGVLSEGILSKTHGAESVDRTVDAVAGHVTDTANDKTPHSSQPSGVLSKNILSMNSTRGSEGPPDPDCEAASS